MLYYDELRHEGVLERSGRYPWGSGEHPYQRLDDFRSVVGSLRKKGMDDKTIAKGLGMSESEFFQADVKALRKSGMKDTDIAKSKGMTTTEFRQKVSLAKAEQSERDLARILKYKNQGLGTTAIAKKMGIPEATVRSKLNPVVKERAKKTEAIANDLKARVDDKKYLDIGKGAETYLGVSATKLQTAVKKLKDEGYTVHYLSVQQLGTGKKTSVKVLAGPGVDWKEVNANSTNISQVADGYTKTSDGRTLLGIKKPVSVDSKRIQIRYAEEGGVNKDGVIELRRGVEDISLGNSNYAQVRIAVDGTHYLKGMAMYSDKMPKGVDIIFNTNKHQGTPKEDVFKKLKDDPDNPFGATIKPTGQREYIDKDGKKQQSAINIVNEEGDWDKWSKTLSSQMLSKQPVELAKKQLDLAYKTRADEFAEINSVTNPVVKEKLLESFSSDCDAAAAHLKAAALPRQRAQVLLPLNTIGDKECYAPNFRDGETVVLIRYPHGGTFEIPELRVNNRNQEARKVIGTQAKDAIGINSKVAEQLSGADFDGDTAIVIPTRGVKIKSSPTLKQLQNFDPKEAYPNPDRSEAGKTCADNGFHKQREMGNVSNLITDMTIKGASLDEISRAVKHSMVVIDAEKHNLDWRQSAIDNGIPELKRKYQGGANAGASTLISRARGDRRVPERKDNPKIDPETGKLIYEETGRTYLDKKGKEQPSLTKVKGMSTVEDARELSSGTMMEAAYASYANRLKSMANEARKNMVHVEHIPYSPEAKKAYAEEVANLDAKIRGYMANKPRERQAQLLANAVYKARLDANPNMENDEKKKVKNQALAAARARVGAKSEPIEITDREWAAIQAGAVTKTKMRTITEGADLDALKKRAMPRDQKGLTSSKVARAKAMLASGHTQAEVADALGVSVSTLRNNL